MREGLLAVDDEDQRIDIEDAGVAEKVRQAVHETPRGRTAILDELNRKLTRRGPRLVNYTAHRWG
jgi:hypothetical protein